MGVGLIRVMVSVLALTVLVGSAADAATHCVKPGGADGCFASIKTALVACVASDTVAVYPGEYLESDTINKAGVVVMAIGAPCEVKLLPPIGDGFNVLPGATGAVIQGFKIEAVSGWGIYSYGVNFQVRNCVVSNCANSGIVMASYGERALQNCVFVYNSSHGIECTSGSVTADNCIVAWNQRYGIAETSIGTITSRHCDVWENTGGAYTGTVTHSTDIAEDPLFESYCFHLQAMSPCINAGSTADSFLDCDGTRNDMGIFGGRYGYCGPGPVVTSLTLTPATVVKGETFRIDAVGAAR